MIQSKSPTVLYINKLSVLLVSFLLLILWINLEFNKVKHQVLTNPIDTKNSSFESESSKYLKTLSVNPFSKSHDDPLSTDLLPTVTSLQSSFPLFTSLNLKLHGIVFQRNQNSYAMISMKGAIQEIYSVDDRVSEGLYLTKIDKKRVAVNYFGEVYFLTIESTNIDKSSTENTITNGNGGNSNLNFNQQIDFLEVDKQRNPIRLFMIRRPYPVYKDGEFQGYKIMPGSNADQFKRLGFESGDIITYLNGIEFTGPGMKEYIIQQLTHEMTIDLTVIRNTQQLNINYGF